jgi:hypothetical protein
MSFFGSNLFFNHSHVVDGNIIVHSHPYKADKEGKPLHNHTENSFVLVHLLNNIILIAAIALILAALSVYLFRELKSFLYSLNLSLNQGLQLRKRGPPAIMLS